MPRDQNLNLLERISEAVEEAVERVKDWHLNEAAPAIPRTWVAILIGKQT